MGMSTKIQSSFAQTFRKRERLKQTLPLIVKYGFYFITDVYSQLLAAVLSFLHFRLKYPAREFLMVGKARRAQSKRWSISTVRCMLDSEETECKD